MAKHWQSGQVVEIALGDGCLSYGLVLDFPLMAFFDVCVRERPDLESILNSAVLFRIWVMKYAITKEVWKVVGKTEVPDTLMVRPKFFKKDPISGELSTTFVGAGDEQPATLEECLKLECAAGWDPQHVEDRLRDHFAGRPNKWVESLRPERVRGKKS